MDVHMPKSLRVTGWLSVSAIVAVVVSCVIGPAARAQVAGIAGNWQGTLEVGKGSRIVVKISPTSDAQHPGSQGLLYFLDSDMAYEGHNTTTLSVEGGVVRFTIAPIDVRYEGKLSTDGASMAGMWTQGDSPAHPLTLTRAEGDAAWVIPKEDAPMAKNADPDWEVATVKPSDPNDHSAGFHLRGRRFFIERQTVLSMLIVGYGINEKQVVGAPDWIGAERWDVDGIPDVAGKPSLKQQQSMVRKILAERFGLRTHTEPREMSVYAITVAKGGLRLEKSAGDPDGLMDESDSSNGGQRSMRMTNSTMADFALLMKFMVDRPVVDQTGLTARYDFKLKWTFDELRVPTDGTAAPSLFTAVQEQMGLKLDTVKARTDVLVIDKIERPSAN
jgi:uncharacterized protein (TIGR03435 family)